MASEASKPTKTLPELWINMHETAAHITLTVPVQPDLAEGDFVSFSMSADGYSFLRRMQVHAIRPAGFGQFDVELEDCGL